MKKIFLIFGALALMGFAPHAFAEGFVALAPIPGLTQGATADTTGLANFLNNLYKFLIGIAAVLAVIEIVWAGFRIAGNQDNVSTITDAKGRIAQALFGLVLVLSPALVFSIINPSILNLSINLPELDTQSKSVPSSTGTGNVTAATSAGCSAANNQGVVGCPTQQAATAFVASCSNGTGRTYVSDDPNYPYAATCNDLKTVNPTNGAQEIYTDKSKIPAGYWCYVRMGGTALEYVCQTTKDACDMLVIQGGASDPRYRGGCRGPAPF